MTHLEIYMYLKKNLGVPSLAFNWTSEYNKKFFMFIDENVPEDYLKKEENLLEIKEAFKKYFEPVGYILFQIKHYQIRLKVFPYNVEPKDCEQMDEIVDIIDENRHLIENEYNGKKDQIFIREELRALIFDFVETIDNKNINKKDLVKHAVREALTLKHNDIVMVKTDCIFIKLCDIVKEYKVIDAEQNIVERRYNGISEKELQSFTKEHFSDKEDVKFFHLIAKTFVDRYFLNNKISNLEYEKNVFSYIKAIIADELMNTFDNCEDFFTGLSGYLFRNHFEEVFKNIAELVFIEISMSNDYMIDFLKYYSLDVVVLDGIKYKVPSIETENGLRWNVVSMLSIVRLYVKTKLASKIILDDINNKESEIMLSFKEGLSPLEYSNKINEKNKKFTDKMVEYNHKLDRCHDSLKLAKTESRKDTLAREINLIKKEMQNIREEVKQLLSKAIPKSDVNKYVMLEKEIDSMRRQLTREERILNQNEESFQSVKLALVKALISKKQRV